MKCFQKRRQKLQKAVADRVNSSSSKGYGTFIHSASLPIALSSARLSKQPPSEMWKLTLFVALVVVLARECSGYIWEQTKIRGYDPWERK